MQAAIYTGDCRKQVVGGSQTCMNDYKQTEMLWVFHNIRSQGWLNIRKVMGMTA